MPKPEKLVGYTNPETCAEWCLDCMTQEEGITAPNKMVFKTIHNTITNEDGDFDDDVRCVECGVELRNII